ncbi:penicillin-binding protein activator [Marinicella rhabdoformis]|uniref:penicillin-binding protein activator n=1 Tax=Marinicella rhabdoformis TaxID=2580566 RepID=UPI0012AEC17B|nr:penicillin-binding protein activator [Marinicella rhabdoformis]
MNINHWNVKVSVRHAALLTVFSLLLACGGNNVRPDGLNEQRKGMALYQAGDYFNAVSWLEQSHNAHPNKTVLLALIDAYGRLGESIKIYPLLNHELLSYSAEKDIITAQLADQDGNCSSVIDLLGALNVSEVTGHWKSEYYNLLSACHARLGNSLLAAKNILALMQLPTDEQNSTDNKVSDDLVYELMKVPEMDLIQAISETDDELWRGWLEAAFVEFGADGESGEHWFSQWKNHPASSYFLGSNEVSLRQKVGVLLPMSGRFEHVAKAVQKGMLTAAMSQGGRNELLFFDTGSQGEALASALFSAQEAGVNIILGPLDKQSIAALEALPEPTVPVLLLNQSNSDDYQFTLSPEAEAQDVAEVMYQQGKRQVLILSSNDPWGERITLAFAQRFVDLGGQIISNHYFATDQADYSAQLRQVLGLVGSRLRSKNLQQYLKLPVHSEEVVRADIDAIFLAAQPGFARMMVPQLKFNRAAKVPVYATSHVFVGFDNKQHNKDLEGVYFPVAPLLLQTGDFLETLAFDVSLIQNTDLNLFAFGYDAYQLTSRLTWMSRVNSGKFSGLSGNLSMDFDGKIRRHLPWAYYIGGEVFAAEQ